MIIRQVVPSLELQHGGPSRSVRALARAQAELGHDVSLLATDPNAPERGRLEREGPLHVGLFRRNWPGRICWSAGLRKSLQTGRADVVHHHALWLRTLHYAHVAARFHGAPLVVSPRGMMGPWAWRHHRTRKALADHFLHPGVLRAVIGWHATSEQEARDIAALGFHQPVCVAPNGVDSPTEDAVEAARAYWSPLNRDLAGRRVALFYSRLHRKKRLLELFELWARVAMPDWHLLVVGIPEEFSVAQLTLRLKELGMGDRASVHDGTDAPPPYSAASLFLLPSHDENFGLSIAEAMAWGLPVVVTDTTPWREVNTREIGWCVPWADYPDALRTALQAPAEVLRAKGESARTWVLENFSWHRSARLLANFYGELRRLS